MAVVDLDLATRVEGDAGRYSGTVHESWFIWGPNGGFLASLALRATVAESRFARLASLSCQFLGVARAGPIAISVALLRRAGAAEAFRVELVQGDRTILAALVWLVDGDRPTLVHCDRAAPAVPPPESVPDLEAVLGPTSVPLFQRIERRQVEAPAGEETRAAPRLRTWMRFRPTACYDDPVVDRLRALIVSDTLYWPATRAAHGPEAAAFTAPGLDLYVRFHDFDPPGAWLLCDTHAELSGEGLLASRSEVWSAGGRLVASSAVQAMLRPVAPPPQPS